MAEVCILSGIEIPKGKYSREHYCPKSRLENLAQHPYNIFPAIKIFNHIKGSLMPCEWEEQKYDLVYHAYNNWHIKRDDRKLLRQALNGMPKINPCQYCICAKHVQYCVNKELLERSR
jgi:hypothetical protein